MSREPLLAFGLTFVSYLSFSMGAGLLLSFLHGAHRHGKFLSAGEFLFVCFDLSAEVRDKESGGHFVCPSSKGSLAPTVSSSHSFSSKNQMANLP